MEIVTIITIIVATIAFYFLTNALMGGADLSGAAKTAQQKVNQSSVSVQQIASTQAAQQQVQQKIQEVQRQVQSPSFDAGTQAAAGAKLAQLQAELALLNAQQAALQTQAAIKLSPTEELALYLKNHNIKQLSSIEKVIDLGNTSNHYKLANQTDIGSMNASWTIAVMFNDVGGPNGKYRNFFYRGANDSDATDRTPSFFLVPGGHKILIPTKSATHSDQAWGVSAHIDYKPNQWNEFVMTYDGSVGRFYLNGSEVGHVSLGQVFQYDDAKAHLYTSHPKPVSDWTPVTGVQTKFYRASTKALSAEQVREMHRLIQS